MILKPRKSPPHREPSSSHQTCQSQQRAIAPKYNSRRTVPAGMLFRAKGASKRGLPSQRAAADSKRWRRISIWPIRKKGLGHQGLEKAEEPQENWLNPVYSMGGLAHSQGNYDWTHLLCRAQ